MQRFRALSIATVLLVLGSIGLSACGDDPTATPVQPTATSRPAATSTPAATATTPPPQSRVATSAEVSAIEAALANAKDLQTYHFDIEVKPSTFITQPVQAQGDYEAPDLTYVKGTMGKQSFENIIIGDVVFEKNSSGDYVKKEVVPENSSDPLSSFSSDSFISTSNPLKDVDSFAEAISEYDYVGDLQVDGVKVKHYTFKIDLQKLAGDQGMTGIDISDLDLGGGGFIVDEANETLYGVEYNLNVSAFIELIARAFASFGGTPTPGGAAPTPLPRLDVNMVMKITRHNDKSIKVPVTAEMRAQLEATPTEEPDIEFPTAVVDETPVVEATPEVDETPVSGDETPIVRATATAGSQGSSELFDVVAPVYYTTTYGYGYIVGVIKYNGTEIRAQPDIVATLVDSKGLVLATEDASIRPGIIVPGKVIPYQALISDPPDNIADIEVTIDADVASDFDLEFGYYKLETEGTSMVKPKNTYDNLKILGRVKNTGDQTATFVQIIGVAYDAAGKVIDVNSTYSKVDDIKAGATSPFELEFNNVKDAASYDLVVTGWPSN